MSTIQRLTEDEMYAASARKDSEYDGVFFLGVKTTGIFCRPACPARMPLRKNVEYFSDSEAALNAGYRPCKKCRPLDRAGSMPGWLENLVHQLDNSAARNWTDQDIRKKGVDPKRVRRWFQQNHGITFHEFQRSRRLSDALAALSSGEDATQVAYDAGYESLSGFRDAFQKWFGLTPGSLNGKGRVNGHSEQTVLSVTRVLSPLGPIVLAASSEKLYLLEFADRKNIEWQIQKLAKWTDCRFCPGENRITRKTASQLKQYFDGKRMNFDLPLEIPGTEFQVSVWAQLQQINYATTRSYEQVARAIGKPTAQRAVGKANGDNRLSIILPCHRVIRADGQLSGYGGGLRRKQWLLDHERDHASAISTDIPL